MTLSNEQRGQLIEAALGARKWAYAPYSKYKVGAALVTSSGKIYDGVNIENAAYPSGICAERVAVFKAVSEGEREFNTIVVATQNGGTPCGACRQVLAEFGLDTQVIIVNGKGKVTQETSVKDLLPGAFTSSSLKADS
jgi:cytidine deaminase